MTQNRNIEILNWGTLDYQTAWDQQEMILKQQVSLKQQGLPTTNYLIFVEHPNVYTLGKSGNIDNVLLSDQELADKNIQFFKTNRGGDITYHGPGQIVGYPIFDLENFKPDIGWYLRTMEQAIINTLAIYGINGDRSAGETGVWLEPQIVGKERKICAMGVRCSRWVTMHGFALNVNVDVSYFSHIVPCGIANKAVASMHQELNSVVNIGAVQQQIATQFELLFTNGSY
jgi:lipoyl(octanoyl) transferase